MRFPAFGAEADRDSSLWRNVDHNARLAVVDEFAVTPFGAAP